METSEKYILWKKRRSQTRILANILIFFAGVEAQCVTVTTIYYLHDSMKYSLEDAGFYYSIIETFYSISNGLFSIWFGRYVDKTRNLRFMFLLNLALIVLGNLMYSIPYRLWWIIVGRFFCGTNEALQTTVCGEFYSCHKITIIYTLIETFTYHTLRSLPP